MDGPFEMMTSDTIHMASNSMRPPRRVPRWLLGSLVLMSIMTCCFAVTDVASAEEPVIDFIDGLRQRGYYDTAIEYIDSVSLREDISAEVRDQLDLQRGITQQQRGSVSRNPDEREQALSLAETALRKFLQEKPQHSQAATANSILGELLFERARSLTWKVDETEDPSTKLELQQSARTLIDQAKVIYQTARDQFKAQYEAFPKFVEKDEPQFMARQEAESRFLRAWFNLIRCTYERGQTFEKGTEERKNTLIEAAGLFEELHTSRRTNQIGLHARLLMGKCFQEQDDIGRALGIYNEMLGHKSESTAVEQLKGIAQHYRLICLNDPQKNDFQLVITEATNWIAANRSLSTTPSGLGIQWEKAIAEEKLGLNRSTPEDQRKTLLTAAMNDARGVAKYPGPYREPALAMERRLKSELGEKDREPRDFSTAFERAKGMIGQIAEFNDAVASAKDTNEKNQKQAELTNHLAEVGRLLQLALDLREPDSDDKAVAQTRYLLSYVFFMQKKHLDSVILASYCMTNDKKADPDNALNATEIAISAAVAAWNAAPGKDREFETRLLQDVCLKIVELYPQSSRAGEARMRLGSVYMKLNKPAEGARWFLQVPESDPQHISAKIYAGQAYWAAWTQRTALAAANPEGEQPTAAKMAQWRADAKALLTQGIQMMRQKLGDGARPTDEVVAAEVSLAGILNLDNEFQSTIDRITGGAENSVVAMIEVPEGSERPEDGIQSKSFASLTYRLLLRAFVGTQKIDEALAIMSKLERVGGSDILQAYTQLGIELQEELKRLNQAGDATRLAAVRDSFEKFLQQVYQSRNKSDYNSLLWIGETYYGLGLGVLADPTAAESYFSRAGDAYNEIVTGNLTTDSNRNAVLLRLARCRRQQKKYEDGLKIVTDVLAQNANAIDAQFEAAQMLTDWAVNGDAGSPRPEKFTEALQGIKGADGKPMVWGWPTLARRLQQYSEKDPSSDLKARFIEARYELSAGRRRFAKVHAADAEKQQASALAEITSFVQRYRDLDDVNFAKFDRLYQDLQVDRGGAPEPLQRTAAVELPTDEPAKADSKEATAPVVAPTEQPTTPGATAAPEGGSGWLLPVIGLALCAGLGAVFFFLMRKPKQRVRIPGSSSAPKLSGFVPDASSDGLALPSGLSFDAPQIPDFTTLGAAVATKKASPSKPRPAAASASGASGPAASGASSTGTPRPPGAPADPARPRPAAPKDAAAGSAAPGTPAPRPRPKPPEGGAPAPSPASRPVAPTGDPAAPRPTRPAAPKPPAAPTGTTPAASADPNRPATPRPAAPRPAGQPTAGANPAGQPPAAPRPAAPRPATPKPPSAPTDGSAPAANPPGERPSTPRPAAPKPAAPKPATSGDAPAPPRPKPPKPPEDLG
jgi:hypothetical protein